MIEHVGHEHTRVFRECAELGRELEQLGDTLLDARTEAKIAIVYDWENRWATELSSGPTIALNYVNEVHKYYDALFQMHVESDMVSVEEDLSKYEIVIAPVMYMVKPGFAQKVEQFVAKGGTFITTFFSGIVNENDIVTTGGYPGELRKVLGIWAEEIDALFPDQKNQIVMKQAWGQLEGQFECGLLCDLIHSEGAEVLAEYGSDFYKGMPVLTKNSFGSGHAYYVASSPEASFLEGFLANLCDEKGIKPLLHAPAGVEVARRVKSDKEFLFLLNHNAESAEVEIGSEGKKDLLAGKNVKDSVTVPGRGVIILEDQRK